MAQTHVAATEINYPVASNILSNLTSNATRTVGFAGLVVGVLDATAGVIVYTGILRRFSVLQVLQWIASGAFGPSAFAGGLSAAAWGVLFHFIIAYVCALVFFLAYPRVPQLRGGPIAAGFVYGAAVWAVMNLVVLPLSNVPPAPFEWHVAAMAVTWHMALVGVPIAVLTNAYYEA